MEHAKLVKRLAELESINDQLMSELEYLDTLMRSVGFTNGLATVKATALELFEKGEEGHTEEEDKAA
jgi:hypothetical protein